MIDVYTRSGISSRRKTGAYFLELCIICCRSIHVHKDGVECKNYLIPKLWYFEGDMNAEISVFVEFYFKHYQYKSSMRMI